MSCSLSLSLSLSLCFSGLLWFQASIRRSSSYLIGYFFRNSKLYLVDEAPNIISTLIILLSDSDSSTVVVHPTCNYCAVDLLILDRILYSFLQVAWEALSRVVSSIPKEVLPSYVKLVRDAVSTSRDRERRKKKVRSSLHVYKLLIL